MVLSGLTQTNHLLKAFCHMSCPHWSSLWTSLVDISFWHSKCWTRQHSTAPREIGHPEVAELLYYLLVTKQSPKRICKQKMCFRHFNIRNYNSRRGFERFCEWPERLLSQEEKAPRRQCACSSPAHAHWMWFPHRHSCLSHCNSSATIPRLLPLSPLQTAPKPPSPKQCPLWRNSAPLSHKTLQKPWSPGRTIFSGPSHKFQDPGHGCCASTHRFIG